MRNLRLVQLEPAFGTHDYIHPVGVVKNTKMHFILRGFKQVMGFRVFTFEGITEERVRSIFTVRADLSLAHRYDVPLQDLPVLCRSVLERLHDSGDKRAYAFTEEDMCLFAKDMAARALAAKQRKPARRPVTDNTGVAWRAPQR
jgi:hypothetical protein